MLRYKLLSRIVVEFSGSGWIGVGFEGSGAVDLGGGEERGN